MVLIHRWSAKARWQCVAAFALVTLSAGAAHAAPTIHQTQTRSRAPRQCSDCAEQEKRQRVREALLLQLDSLRWEIEHRRLTETERAHAATQFAKTLMALEAEAAAQVSEPHRAVAVAVESARARGARGYIGVTFDGLWARPPGSKDDNIIRFYEYPQIALVESSSPAERAGVLAGDTLLALNGDDVKENEIAFGKLLIPRKRITMRVRREGSAKDLIVTMAGGIRSMRRT